MPHPKPASTSPVMFAFVQFVAVMPALSPLAFAQDPPTSSTATSTAFAQSDNQPDKSQFTLLNPTPTAQLRGMDTDRPNFTNTPHTVDAGHLQIEAGAIDFTYFRDHAMGNNFRQDNFSLGQFNFRLGVLNNLELNAVINSYDYVDAHNYSAHDSLHASSFGDTVLGGKLNLWGEETGDAVWATALAIQPQFKIATASNTTGNGHFEWVVAAPFLMNLPAGFHLGIQSAVAGQRNSANTGYTAAFPSSISVDRVVIGNLDVYLEYACTPTTQKHIDIAQTIDIGGTLPLNDNVVLDAGVNFGLNHLSNNVEALAGISVRF